MKIVGLTGSLTSSSKTFIAVDKALNFAKKHNPDIETIHLHLKDLSVDYCDGRDPSLYEADTKYLIDQITSADGYIIGSPIYRGTYTGALKNVFDLIPNDVLRGKVVGFIATGGTYHHYLALEHQFKPLAGYFKAHVIPGSVYIHNEHFVNKQLSNDEIIERLEALASDVVSLTSLIDKRFEGAHQPAIPRKVLV
jgi:MsuE subfamily FMN reductase